MLKRRVLSIVFALAAVIGLAAPALAQDIVDGSTGPGSVYRLIRPTNWNGILLLYAHGYVSPEAPVGISPDAQLVASLVVPHGFAVAISSFSENGWVVKMAPSARTSSSGCLLRSSANRPASTWPARRWAGSSRSASPRPGPASLRA